jgi:hypothetical protein
LAALACGQQDHHHHQQRRRQRKATARAVDNLGAKRGLGGLVSLCWFIVAPCLACRPVNPAAG